MVNDKRVFFACHSEFYKNPQKLSLFILFGERKDLEDIKLVKPIKEFRHKVSTVDEIVKYIKKERQSVDYTFFESNLGFLGQEVWTIDPDMLDKVMFFDGSYLSKTQHLNFFNDAKAVIEKIKNNS